MLRKVTKNEKRSFCIVLSHKFSSLSNVTVATRINDSNSIRAQKAFCGQKWTKKYILGVLTHTTAWDQHWGGNETLQ